MLVLWDASQTFSNLRAVPPLNPDIGCMRICRPGAFLLA
jgi:hypothetical protein